MRILFVIIGFIWSAHISAQYEKYIGVWVSEDQDVMAIRDTMGLHGNTSILGSGMGDMERAVYLYGDTLSFQYQYTSVIGGVEKFNIERYDLKIAEESDTSLTVIPVSPWAIKAFNYRNNIHFVKQAYNIDPTIQFEKIVYRSDACHGSCPIYHLEIRNDRSFYIDVTFFNPLHWTEIDNNKSGIFIGTLDETMYAELIRHIQTSNLKTLFFTDTCISDLPLQTIIIYYNGQRKYLKSKLPPVIVSNLVQFLNQLYDRAPLTKTQEKKQLER